MKVTLSYDGFELDIRARHTYETRASKKAALDFLNLLAIVYHDAADHIRAEHPETDRDIFGYRRTAEQLHGICDAAGLYDEFRD